MDKIQPSAGWKTLEITVKESAMTTYIQQRSIDTHSFSVQFQVNVSSCFNFSSQLYDIHFVNIYLNILKYIKIYICFKG